MKRITEDTFSQGRKDWGARMDKITSNLKKKQEKEREAKKAKARDQIAQGNKEYYATRKAMKNESEGLDELYVKDSEKAFELKSKIEKLKKTHAKHVATLASTPNIAANSEKRFDLGLKIDGLKRNIKKHVDAHKKLAPAEYHESVEELDELKRSTLNSYIAKGRRDADLGGMYAASGRTPRTPYEKKLQNRYKGAIKATMKLSRGDYQKESIEESIKAGDHVTHQGKTYKVFRADGTTLHVGQRHGDNRYGGSKMLHTSKVEKITKLSPDEEAARKEKFMSTFEKTRKEKQARTMKKRGMPDTASKLSKEETSEKLSNAINSLRNL